MPNREFQGYVNVRQVMGKSMFTLRADLASTKVKVAIKFVTGVALPKIGTCVPAGSRVIL
jgi:hypothetical protein